MAIQMQNPYSIRNNPQFYMYILHFKLKSYLRNLQMNNRLNMHLHGIGKNPQ